MESCMQSPTHFLHSKDVEMHHTGRLGGTLSTCISRPTHHIPGLGSNRVGGHGERARQAGSVKMQSDHRGRSKCETPPGCVKIGSTEAVVMAFSIVERVPVLAVLVVSRHDRVRKREGPSSTWNLKLETVTYSSDTTIFHSKHALCFQRRSRTW